MMLWAAALSFVLGRFLAETPVPDRPAQIAELGARPAMAFLDRESVFLAARGPRYQERLDFARTPTHLASAFLAAQGRSTSILLAETLYPSPDSSLRTALRRWFLAARLWAQLSPDQRLALYLERAPIAPGVHGVPAASRLLLGKSPSELSLAESALLAALAQSPHVDPVQDPEPGLLRARRILDRLHEKRFITDAQRAAAELTRISLLQRRLREDPELSPVFDAAADQVVRLSGADEPVSVRLSLRADLQSAANELLARYGGERAVLAAVATDGSPRAIAVAGGVQAPRRLPTLLVEDVRTSAGEVIWRRTDSLAGSDREEALNLSIGVMTAAVERATGRPFRSPPAFAGAGSNRSGAWFVGAAGDLAAAVWTESGDPSAPNQAPAAVWRRFMAQDRAAEASPLGGVRAP